jgi:type II secretory ATPase GspE/PulE/Tfp pilus assembly ATPase PilB-like protein
MALFGKKKKAVPPEEQAPKISFIPKGAAAEMDNQKNLLMAKQSPAFLFVQRLVADALDRRGGGILLDYTQQAVAVRYEIDGLWLQSATLDRMTGDAMLAVMKVLANLNIQERRARQKGEFGAQYRKAKYNCLITTEGVPTGERVTIQIENPAVKKPQTIEELGMREKMMEQVRELFALHEGFILISAPPAGGFTTTFSALLRSADRFTRNFSEVQAVDGDKAVENVPLTSYDPSKGETPMTVIPKLLRTYPDVIAIRDLVNAETLEKLCDQVEEKRLIVAGVRAKETVEALLRVLALKAPAQKFASVITAVLNQRLLRTLCENCKVPYVPPPQVLHQLGIPQGKVAAFYRPHEGPLPPQTEKEEPRMCPNCGGMGYRGRTAVFELLVMNDDLRKLLAKSPGIDVLRAEARKSGMRTLQEEGIVLVARGVTSLPELLRVLKE